MGRGWDSGPDEVLDLARVKSTQSELWFGLPTGGESRNGGA